MGTWGIGNFDSDGALDAKDIFNDKLFARIIELLKHPRGHEYDEAEIDELFVTIEIIFILHSKDLINGTPKSKEFEILLEPYFDRWEEYFRSCGKQPPNDRKRVMQETFNKLCAIADGMI